MAQQLHSWIYIYLKDTHTSTLVAALFTVAEIWKNPKCVCIYMEYFSVIKKNQILPFVVT